MSGNVKKGNRCKTVSFFNIKKVPYALSGAYG